MYTSVYIKRQLDNGLILQVCHLPGVTWQYVEFVITTGSIFDPVGKEGLAHFVEHIVNENATLSSDEMGRYFRSLGGGINSGLTGYNATTFGFKIPSDAAILEKSLDLLGGMLVRDAPSKGVDKERSIILQEYAQDYPEAYRVDLIRRECEMVYAGHVRSRLFSPLGTPDSIGGISLDDLRGFHQAYYTPANITVVCTGAFAPEQLTNLISRSLFGRPTTGRRYEVPSIEAPPAPRERSYDFIRSKVMRDASPDDPGGYRTVCALPGNVNRDALMFLDILLSKMLFDDLREQRQWTYHVDVDRHFIAGVWEFVIDCDGVPPAVVDSIEEAVRQNIAAVAASEKIFEEIRHGMLNGMRMNDMNGSRIHGRAVNDLKVDKVICSDEQLRRDVERLTFEDVVALLPHLAPERRWTLLTRP